MRRISLVVAALALAALAVHAAAAGAVPPPTHECGTIARPVPLRPARLETIGWYGDPPSCATARRVMRRFLRTHAHRVLGWRCRGPFTAGDGRTFHPGSCLRGRAQRDEVEIDAFVPLPHSDP